MKKFNQSYLLNVLPSLGSIHEPGKWKKVSSPFLGLLSFDSSICFINIHNISFFMYSCIYYKFHRGIKSSLQ